jgi:oxygen-dependent protoporphyrinogen oxidase
VIIGAGISGLAAAHRLTQVDARLRITILESAGRVGGQIATERIDGYVIEAGPDLFLASKPAAVELCAELGIADRLHGTNPAVKGSYILRRGRLHRLPDGLSGLVPSRFTPFARSPLLSPLGKLRVALDLLIPKRRGDDDESVQSFVVRRLGRQMYERLVEPLLSGIYAGDGARLSINATFPQLRTFEREHGGMLRGMLAQKRTSKASTAHGHTGFVSLPTGVQELVDTLEQKLRANARVSLQTGVDVKTVSRSQPGGYDVHTSAGESIHADAVLVTTPAYVAADLLERLDSPLAAVLRAVPYVSTATVTVGYPESAVPRPLDATGYTVPRVEGRAVLACTWSSSKFRGRAPDGRVLLRIYLGGAGREAILDQPDDALLAAARAELEQVLGITATPDLVRVRRWRRSMPQYNLGHLERLADVRTRIANLPGLALAGSAYGGVGIPDCVRTARAAAEELTDFLSRTRPAEQQAS